MSDRRQRRTQGALVAEHVAWSRAHWRDTPHEFVACYGSRLCDKCDDLSDRPIHRAQGSPRAMSDALTDELRRYGLTPGSENEKAEGRERTHFASEHASIVQYYGSQFQKSAPIWAFQTDREVSVETREGLLPEIPAGYWIATDGKTVWPIADDFMRENYSALRPAASGMDGLPKHLVMMIHRAIDAGEWTMDDERALDAHVATRQERKADGRCLGSTVYGGVDYIVVQPRQGVHNPQPIDTLVYFGTAPLGAPEAEGEMEPKVWTTDYDMEQFAIDPGHRGDVFANAEDAASCGGGNAAPLYTKPPRAEGLERKAFMAGATAVYDALGVPLEKRGLPEGVSP